MVASAKKGRAGARGIADHDGHGRRDHGAGEHAEPGRDAEVLRQQRGGVAADAVEHGVAQRQLAGVAAHDVPGHRQGREHEQQHEQVGPERRAQRQRRSMASIRISRHSPWGCVDRGTCFSPCRSVHSVPTPNRPVGRRTRISRKIPKYDLLEVGRDVVAGQRVDDADDHRTGHGAVQAAQPAQHHDDEGRQHEVRAHGREHRVLRRQQARGDADEGRAQAERNGVDVVHVHAHQRGGVAVLGHGAARGPGRCGA